MQPPVLGMAAADLLLLAVTAASVGVVAWVAAATPADAQAPTWRRLCLVCGAAVLLVAFFSPLGTLAGRYLLTAHLIQVTLVMGFAPPLLLLGLPVRTERRLVPWIARAGRTLTHPVVAILLVNAVFFAWHLTGPYNTSLRQPWLYALQQVSLLLVSLVFWWPIVGPRASARRGMGSFQKLGYILLATIPQTFAGMTVALARHPLYDGYLAAPRTFGLSVLTDQEIAGACMALVSKLALFAAFTVVFSRLLGDGPADDDGGGGRPPDQPDAPAPVHSLTPSPGWLDLLGEGRTVVEPAPPRERTPSPVV